jgi:peptidoglycan/xylan/chitin deacetylase (PgdA/CDA1 family)
MYHEVSDLPDSEIQGYYNAQKSFCISLDEFEYQIVTLLNSGCKIISIGDLEQKEIKQTRKFVLLSFDDGFVGNYRYALPILQKYHQKAIFFLIAKKIGCHPYMTWDDVRNLAAAGMCIGSHGCSHRIIAGNNKEMLWEELARSKEIIEEQINQEINAISFPHGAYDSISLSLARKAGYRYVFTSDYGFTIKKREGLLLFPRMPVCRDLTDKKFEGLISPGLLMFFRNMVGSSVKKTIKQIIGFENYLYLYTKFHGLSE